ncbi:MAG: hypothetical protein U0R64_00155 [Candidatus Nanopelagicales bacterium]
MDPFDRALDEWQPVFVLIGGMAATLTGLLFVAVSLGVRTIMSDDHPQLRSSAIRTFNQFLLIMEVSIVALIPRQTPLTLGASIAVLALLAVGITVWTSRDVLTKGVDHGRRSAVTANVMSGLMVLVGIMIAVVGANAMFVLLSLVIAILISSVFEAWYLLVQLGQDEAGSEGGGNS